MNPTQNLSNSVRYRHVLQLPASTIERQLVFNTINFTESKSDDCKVTSKEVRLLVNSCEDHIGGKLCAEEVMSKAEIKVECLAPEEERENQDTSCDVIQPNEEIKPFQYVNVEMVDEKKDFKGTGEGIEFLQIKEETSEIKIKEEDNIQIKSELETSDDYSINYYDNLHEVTNDDLMEEFDVPDLLTVETVKGKF